LYVIKLGEIIVVAVTFIGHPPSALRLLELLHDVENGEVAVKRNSVGIKKYR